MALLRDCGPLKAWSVVVTVLGDLCTAREDRISGRLLRALAGRMGLSPQAVRVAVHRLRGDGWIESDRAGRESLYRLSAEGWRETQAVRPVIYPGADPARDTPWILVAPATMAAADFTARLPAAAVALGPRTALLAAPPREMPAEVFLARAQPDHIPGWVADQLAGTALRAEYSVLRDRAVRVTAGPLPDDLLDATVLRLLVLHHWRRLRLRHGPLPDMLLGDNWEGAEARRAVAHALHTFPRRTPDALERVLERVGQD